MLSKQEHIKFTQKGEAIITPCRHLFYDFRNLVKTKIGDSVVYDDAEINLDYASFSVLVAIAQDRLSEDSEILHYISIFDSKTKELRKLLIEYDGEGSFLSLNHINDLFNPDLTNVSRRSIQLYIKYESADLSWLTRAYNGVVMPVRYSHKPYRQSVYMVMDIDHVCKIFSTRKLKFTLVDSWEDPYENVFLRYLLPSVKGTALFGQVSKRVYGECWSTKENSDAMWRIYSKDPDKNGRRFHSVQLCTTIDKLVSLVTQTSHPISSFGLVSYDDEKNTLFSSLKEKWEHALMKSFPPLDAFAWESLYYKRNCFEHENEFRTIIWIDNSSKHSLKSVGIIEDCGAVKNKFLNVDLKIDPNLFFDRIVLDPRLIDKPALRNQYTNELLNAGVVSSIISVSQLYNPPSV